MIEFARIGLGWFIGTATFVGCWIVLIALLGLLFGLLNGGADDDE